MTEVMVDAAGAIVAGAAPQDLIRVAPVDAAARPLSLWLLRFEKPLTAL
ncbi:hypothetical protein LP419_22415 [Massilia sp. H-1]|nr:hypothetical protein LP419_22415 [Massilia sp. H-1]